MSVSTPFQEEAHQHLASGDVPAYMQALGQAARRAASELRRADTGLKNSALMAMAQRLAAWPPERLRERAVRPLSAKRCSNRRHD